VRRHAVSLLLAAALAAQADMLVAVETTRDQLAGSDVSVLRTVEGAVLCRVPESALGRLSASGFRSRVLDPAFSPGRYYLVPHTRLNPPGAPAAPLWDDARQAVVRLDETQALAAQQAGWHLAALPKKGYPAREAVGDPFHWQPDTLVARIVDSVALPPLVADLRSLQGFRTRYTYSPRCESAALWIHDRFVSLGWQTELDTYYINTTRALNVVATLDGESRPDSVVIACAHFDSYTQQGMTNAPGADDNATGTAILLELARVMRDYRFRWTTKLIAFSGEEQWMEGSYHWVDSVAVPQAMKIWGAFNVDMIGYTARDSNYIVVNRNGPSAEMGALAESTNRWYDIRLSILNYLDPDCPGDVQPFWEAGYRGTFALEDSVWGIWRGSNPYYHTIADTVGTLTLGQVQRVGKLTAACVATVAGPTGPTAVQEPVGRTGTGTLGTVLFSHRLSLPGNWHAYGTDGRLVARGLAADFGQSLAPGVYYLKSRSGDEDRRIIRLR